MQFPKVAHVPFDPRDRDLEALMNMLALLMDEKGVESITVLPDLGRSQIEKRGLKIWWEDNVDGVTLRVRTE